MFCRLQCSLQSPGKSSRYLAVLLTAALSACGTATSDQPAAPTQATAPGAPGNASVWAYAGKTGIGTAYEQYLKKEYDDAAPTGKVSRVWFSVAQGIVTETMFGLIHEAQIKELQFLVKGDGFLDVENTDTQSRIEYLHTDSAGRPLSLAYKIVNRDIEGKYEIEKHIFTDPDRDALFMRVMFTAYEADITPYLFLNPHMNNTGSNDIATVTGGALQAQDSGTFLTLKSSKGFEKTSAGFVGVSDGLSDLQDNGVLDWSYNSTGATAGNVALTAQLKTAKNATLIYDFSIGFGQSARQSETAAQQSLDTGYAKVLAHYNGEGDYIGWEDYLAGLDSLAELRVSTTDQGKLLHASAMVLKAQEDKTHAGALIASLSNPWGDTASAKQGATGYKAVWPRDFYQCAMALLALGDHETPLVAFEYLQQVQTKATMPENKGASGWFLQKTHVDGEIEWVGVQLDQTAMPIMLAWKLWKSNILTTVKLAAWYASMLRPAADFLVSGGEVSIDWNKRTIEPPRTQQERWEEQWGYSPSTTAAVITGLVTAADIALHSGDGKNAKRYLAAADSYAATIERTMVTTTGTLTNSNGRYYLRISQNTDPNDNGKLLKNNGRPAMNEKLILDAGFLELVRYGVRAADDEYILDSLPELDDISLPHDLRVKYDFRFAGEPGAYPGWRRYGNDGYGEDAASGANYAADDGKMSAGQRGRVWPFFSGERGHYELALAKARLKPGSAAIDPQAIAQLKNTYVKALELFANEGLMLPEQVWDGVGTNSVHDYTAGEGTNSATPLAWTHAEYIKLLRSIDDQQVWDSYDVVRDRYSN